MSLSRIALSLVLAAALGLAGCGVKGDPERPMPQDETKAESEG